MHRDEVMQPQQQERWDAIIVGGGLAGLTAALHLAERGLVTLVLEADPVALGGRLKAGPAVEFTHACRTWHFPGEHGIHGIWSPYRNLQALWARHGIRPVLVPAQEESWVLGVGSHVRRAPIGRAIRESWIPAPLHYLGLLARPAFWGMLDLRDLAAFLPIFVTLMTALSIDPLLENQPLQGLTLADVCKGWSPRMTALFTGLSRNALPANPGQIPASGFFAFLRFYTLRRRDAWAFSYLPDPAPETLVAPLVRVLGEAAPRGPGSGLRLGAQAQRFWRDRDGWSVAWKQQGAGDVTSVETASCRHLILATDAPAAGALLRAGPDTAPDCDVLNLPTGWPSAVVRFWFDRQPPPGQAEAGILSGDFILDNFFWLSRIYNDYMAWARLTGGSAIEAHIYGPPELLANPDATLLTLAQADLGRVWPSLKGRTIHSSLTRNDATHTLLRAGQPGEHPGVITPWPNLLCCGDWVRDETPAMFMERACVTGIKAANVILREHELPAWPLLPHGAPEPLAWALELQMGRVRAALKRRHTSRGARLTAKS
jgi:carotenoid phi-ring synthase / carotenoid chi-ring synthase